MFSRAGRPTLAARGFQRFLQFQPGFFQLAGGFDLEVAALPLLELLAFGRHDSRFGESCAISLPFISTRPLMARATNFGCAE